ncbi:YggS family pyridoxal phosphate-dependent enzyme [Clostridiaceae bacterium NSJ-31]|uniref:Pyridoxal phosphate homeostasis protein n=1 Tax=Ligaoa zhengdingensis TaxID=2763658 RepID=A0A926DXT3_9FIRM|nr:YggS family pyridoxal phosphate-dependent enzyme [Ligaoa zhengdingensis]MBC8545399.1 YggS family pyridoxal phosphate-dependent enzyme [Ligaoa zhengdingensis]
MENQSIRDEQLKRNIEDVQERVRLAAQRSGRSYEDITILAATKTQDVATINWAIACGIRCIGENRVQELTAKYDGYDREHAAVQFIGHLQVNKVKYIVDKVELIQSVDSLKLAAEIDRQCAKIGHVMDVLVEVNIGGEVSKSGVAPHELEPLLLGLAGLEHIKVRGLMTIPPICENRKQSEQYFSILHKEFLDIRAKTLDNIDMDILSMGMSGDYETAIECGANMIRVGTALFGPRKQLEG